MEALSQALGPDTIIFSDQENHASLVQGIRNTRLPKRIFKHNDAEELERLLAEADPNVPKVRVGVDTKKRGGGINESGVE
jgi:5-aminolevulinate synthase